MDPQDRGDARVVNRDARAVRMEQDVPQRKLAVARVALAGPPTATQSPVASWPPHHSTQRKVRRGGSALTR